MRSTSEAEKGAVCIIILNWNGWKDTIECLESVFCSNYPKFHVVVCDNGSSDASIENIIRWAEGGIDCTIQQESSLDRLISPPVRKPIPYVLHDEELSDDCSNIYTSKTLTIISIGSNLGFAGGNNIGLQFALARDDFAYMWVLNNDTVVDPDALMHMVNHLEEKPLAGICGSTLLYYDMPDTVQALGGFGYNKWLGTSRCIGQFEKFQRDRILQMQERIEKNLFGIQGASMLISKEFLEHVGLLSEDYFLYYEEQDWAVRAQGRYTLAYAADSLVYHKEGAASQGSSKQPGDKSFLSDFYSIRSRIVFTRKFFPWCLPTIYLGLLGVIVKRIMRRQWNRIGMVVRLAISLGNVPIERHKEP